MALLTAQQAAEIPGVAVTTVYGLVQRGQLQRHAKPLVVGPAPPTPRWRPCR